jgi:hypothetical protein
MHNHYEDRYSFNGRDTVPMYDNRFNQTKRAPNFHYKDQSFKTRYLFNTDKKIEKLNLFEIRLVNLMNNINEYGNFLVDKEIRNFIKSYRYQKPSEKPKEKQIQNNERIIESNPRFDRKRKLEDSQEEELDPQLMKIEVIEHDKPHSPFTKEIEETVLEEGEINTKEEIKYQKEEINPQKEVDKYEKPKNIINSQPQVQTQITKVESLPKEIPKTDSPKELSESDLSDIINKTLTDLKNYRSKLAEILEKKNIMKSIPYFFLDEDKSKVNIPEEQMKLYGNCENFVTSVENLKHYFDDWKAYSIDIVHTINAYIYSIHSDTITGSYLFSSISKIFTTLTNEMPFGTMLFEAQSYIPSKKECYPIIEQYPADLIRDCGIGMKIKRNHFSLLSYNPNVAIASGNGINSSLMILIVHKLLVNVKALSISDACYSYETVPALLLDKNLEITITHIEEKEFPVLNLLNPSKKEENKRVKVIYTDVTNGVS